MEVIGRQEMVYPKLTRKRSNCYKDGDYGENVYRGSHNRDGHFTHGSQMGIDNLSSSAKTYDHIPYNDCHENSLYDVHKGVEIVLRWGTADPIVASRVLAQNIFESLTIVDGRSRPTISGRSREVEDVERC
ncbi:hypothetical protein M9H77_08911 [Catharanthus roseus]|uniref:Uncharacterized protein n=1 Tax=Catharanthus roseus TaxID=4058 RepID=A0ACC0BZA5_CATRO|nr:hypothetical protein M9H77_08911 [Catharanthus roseus]